MPVGQATATTGPQGSHVYSPTAAHCGNAQIQSPSGDGRSEQWNVAATTRVVAFGPSMTAGGETFSEQTPRMVVHTSVAGAGVRIHLSNLRGTTALSVGAVDVAVQSSGAAAVPGTHHTVTFGGSGNPTIAAGTELTSDVIPMPVTQAAIRVTVNNWIRTSGAFDAVIDFDAATRDPNNPAQMLPAYDSGDHLHPGDAGMQAMANAIDLSLLR